MRFMKIIFFVLLTALLSGCGRQLAPRVFVDIIGEDNVDVYAMDIFAKKIGFEEARDSPYWNITEAERTVSFRIPAARMFFGYTFKYDQPNNVSILILDYSTEYCEMSPNGVDYVEKLLSFMRREYPYPKFKMVIGGEGFLCRRS